MKSISAPPGDYKNGVPGEFLTMISNMFPDVSLINPDHGPKLGEAIQQTYEKSEREERPLICLVPARTDSAWWHEYAMKGEIIFIRGRLNFGKNRIPAALVIYQKDQGFEDPGFSDVRSWTYINQTKKVFSCGSCGKDIPAGSKSWRGSRLLSGHFKEVRLCEKCRREK